MDQITKFHVQTLRKEEEVLQAKYDAAKTAYEKQEIRRAMRKVECEIAEELGVGRANLTIEICDYSYGKNEQMQVLFMKKVIKLQ